MIGLKTIALATGIWKAIIMLPEQELPFNMIINDVDGFPSITILNAQEQIEVTDIIQKGDSIFIYLPVFDSEIKGVFSEKEINGTWTKYKDPKRSLPFKALHGVSDRFNADAEATINVTGNWEVWFSKGTKDEYKAKGLFKQAGSKVTGTFLTETGDYRYLQGVVERNNLKLSCFDGAHAFLFKATMGDSLSGTFYSGGHWKEPWVAVKNDSFELNDPFELTYLKEGYDKVEFSFRSTDGDTVTLEDERFKNKPVIVQLLGSWCPNCMDESRFYSEIYDEYNTRGLEIVGIAFERSELFNIAKQTALKMKGDLEIPYPILIAGKASKKVASERLPMLNKVISFPTSILINKKGKVVKIHTGFNGPATGEYFEKYKDEFMATLEKMLE